MKTISLLRQVLLVATMVIALGSIGAVTNVDAADRYAGYTIHMAYIGGLMINLFDGKVRSWLLNLERTFLMRDILIRYVDSV